MTAPIDLTPASDAEARLFRLLREITRTFHGLPWTLIGGLMVRILEIEHGQQSQIATVDVDALMDIRATANATRDAAERLMAIGFEPDVSMDAVTYRFTREDDIVDVLAPDGVGRRASTATVPPAETVRAVGGTQALKRGRVIRVDDGEGAIELRVPSLLGAIVIKARVAGQTHGDGQAKHLRDLARLLALIDDPYAMSHALSRSDRRHLRARRALTNAAHPAWLDTRQVQKGSLALAILIDEGEVESAQSR